MTMRSAQVKLKHILQTIYGGMLGKLYQLLLAADSLING
jgi:hypothetical protein